ncbi:MAG TPA: hypothetical protein VKY85_09165 [Candidatus Angelobacter sp.]|nr:hypothetical protein [Candidatus Angelobacter sp.]
MLILFDHGTPAPLRRSLIGHTIATAYELGWATLKNGALLQSAELAGYQLLITTDKSLAYQQNLRGRKIAIIALGQANWPIVRTRIAQIIAAVNAAEAGSYQLVEM